MSSEKSKIETYEGGSVLPPGVHDALIHGDEPNKTDEPQEFDPEWYLCQTSVTLVGKFYYKEELKVGDGPYGRYCSFSLRTKKLKNGTPRTCFFYIKVWGNDLIALLERLPNETFIKVTGDLETWRNSTYIRARSITPMLNLDQHVEELKQKEFLARMENDAEAMEEIRVAREAMRDVVDKARSVINSASGTGWAEMTGEVEEVKETSPSRPSALQRPLLPERESAESAPVVSEPVRISPARGGEAEITKDLPRDEKKEDESIMSAKQDLAYILDVLEDMEEYEDEDDDDTSITEGKKTTHSSDDDDDDDYNDYEDEDEEEEDDPAAGSGRTGDEVKVSVIETNRGEVMGTSETTLSKLEEGRYARMRGEEVRSKLNVSFKQTERERRQEDEYLPPRRAAVVPIEQPDLKDPGGEDTESQREATRKRPAQQAPRRKFGQSIERRRSAKGGGGKKR